MVREASVQASGAESDPLLRVVIADRSCHYRDTLRRVLNHYPCCAIVGEASTLPEAARLAMATDPDIALLDIDLLINQNPGRLRRLAEGFPRLDVIVMLNEESADYRLAVRERWGYTCIVKDQAEEELNRIVASANRAVA
jgi:DNA-binding NarL/FixJ family response regulator